MAPISGPSPPRLIIYHQTTHTQSGEPISVLPLLTTPGIGITHVIVAAIHIHQEDPYDIHLNDHRPSHPRYDVLWSEVRTLQSRGIKVIGMLGGAAPGSFDKNTLDADDDLTFRRYYGPLRDMVQRYGLDGLDLDVEQPMSLAGIVRLIDAIRADFGADFLITLAPVAAALLRMGNLSGFDYFELDAMRGPQINWYNAQFYNGWGVVDMYSAIMAFGWVPEKVVIGLLTSPANGNGFIGCDELRLKYEVLKAAGGRIGGIMGWEYFNSNPGGQEFPWLWAREISQILGRSEPPLPPPETGTIGRTGGYADGDNDEMAPVPTAFEYDSDNIEAEL